MKKAIELLTEAKNKVREQIAVLKRTNEICKLSKEMDDKDDELRNLEDEIECAIQILEMEKEIKIIHTLMETGHIRDNK
jgi:predicted RNase H-like nuclease (RuvC/YqgF family)